jgi:Phospholipase_D-nuclease N-terminal
LLIFDGFFGFVTLALWIFCLADVITTDESACRYLPKVMWLLLVLFVPLAGSIIWLAVGKDRDHARSVRGRVAWERSAPEYPEYDRQGRFASVDPESDAEFLRRCRERAQAQRRKAAEGD